MFNDEDDDWMMDDSGFEETYQVLPASDLLLKSLRDAVEFGGKVVMPGSALETICIPRLNVSYPLMFEVENEANSKVTHVGVLEFSAPEGTIYLPPWLMATIGVASGDFVTLRTVTLHIGSFVKLQPQSVAFLDITDPRAVLEHSLRAYSALTRGDIIQIFYNEQIFEFLIMETKPENSKHAISIVETDLQVDFAPPVGYVEPSPPPKQEKSIAGSLGTSLAKASPITAGSFQAFSGSGNKLRGQADPTRPSATSTTSATPQALKLPPGMVFFGGRTPNSGTTGTPTSDEASGIKSPPPSFKAFGGQANKLR